MTGSAETKTIALAYSGDLDSSAALTWLASEHPGSVVTLTLDVGQSADLRDVRDRALALGALRAHVIDVREEFARTAVVPALALGVDELRVASLGRPMVAKYLAQVAAIEGTLVVAHGSHGPVGDEQGVDALLVSANPAFTVLAPCRDRWSSYEALVEYARGEGVPVAAADSRYTSVRTLWGRSISVTQEEHGWADLPLDAYTLTRSPGVRSTVPAVLALEFSAGAPRALNGVAMPLIELLPSLETIAGSHGIGRLDFPAVPGVRPRIVEEAPAPFVLHKAMKSLAAVVPAMWPAMSGTVRMRCFMGECDVEEVSI